MKKQHHPPLLSLLLLLTASLFYSDQALAKENDEKRDTSAVRQEEAEDYYQRWLNQDVTYIISDEEESVFNSLTSPEEKELFIEQFWRRRDPDLRTAINEFKEEHYRRIAYVNERFYAGVPGWKTDRGMIYILHGPPHEIESYVTGGTYHRSFSEGGGSTVVHPLEVWSYRHIEGVGDDIILEFVDRTYTGTYKLALFPDEKDALLHFDGYGLTLSEQWGISDKQHRPSLIGGRSTAYETRLHNNNPFQRYEIFSKVMIPKKIKYKDLKELVKVEIGFSNLPFRVRSDYFKLNDGEGPGSRHRRDPKQVPVIRARRRRALGPGRPLRRRHQPHQQVHRGVRPGPGDFVRSRAADEGPGGDGPPTRRSCCWTAAPATSST